MFAHTLQSKVVDLDVYLKHLPVYMHLNLLDVNFPSWRTGNLSTKQWNKALKFLDSSILSSHSIYSGNKTSNIISKGVVKQIYNNKNEYLRFLKNWACGGDRGKRTNKQEKLLETFKL